MISKKKGLHRNSERFSVQNQVIYISSLGGGAISRLRTKINLKTAKNMLFCILFRPMGGAIAPFAPLATPLQLRMFRDIVLVSAGSLRIGMNAYEVWAHKIPQIDTKV